MVQFWYKQERRFGENNYVSTIGVSSGKWYFEAQNTNSGDAYLFLGVADTASIGYTDGYVLGGQSGTLPSIAWRGGGAYDGSAKVYSNNSATGSSVNWETEVVGVALDLDNNKLYFHKNGTYQNSGVPTSGSTGTGASSITAASSTGLGFYLLGCGDIAGNSPQAIWEWNFGNGYFGTTAVSSAGTNASGIGIFEYDVPTGYTALSTKGLNL